MELHENAKNPARFVKPNPCGPELALVPYMPDMLAPNCQYTSTTLPRHAFLHHMNILPKCALRKNHNHVIISGRFICDVRLI